MTMLEKILKFILSLMSKQEKLLDIFNEVDAAIDDIEDLVKDVLDEEEIFWEIDYNPLPSKVDNRKNITKIYNQGIKRKPSVTYSCGSCMTQHISNIQSVAIKENIVLSPRARRERAITSFGAHRFRWSTLTNQIKQAVEEWDIESFYFVRNVWSMKRALSKGHILCSGTRKANRGVARKAPYYLTKWLGYWHFFAIVGYDDDKGHFIILNSYWDKSFDKWFNYIKYSDINLLFSTVAFVNKVDEEYVKQVDDRVAKYIKEKSKKSKVKWRRVTWEIFTRNVNLPHLEKMLALLELK